MATIPPPRRTREIRYPTRDGKPMAETQLHLKDMIDTILVLDDRFAGQPDVYVCGNLLLDYEEGNPRKHVSPDVLVALGVPKQPNRDDFWSGREGPGLRRRGNLAEENERLRREIEALRGGRGLA